MATQSSFVKLDMKDNCKTVKSIHSSHYSFHLLSIEYSLSLALSIMKISSEKIQALAGWLSDLECHCPVHRRLRVGSPAGARAGGNQ